MLIREFLWGNDLKAFLLLKSAIFAFPHERHLKPTTATTTWNSKQKPKSAIFCFFSHSFSLKSPFWYSKIMFFRAKSVIHNYSEMLCQTYNIIFQSFGQSHFRSFSFSIFFLSRHYPRPQRVFRQSLSLFRREEGIRSIFWIKEWGINKRLWE